jgi:hypothetical protein
MLKGTYGMTLEEYTDLLARQGLGCAICGAPENADGRSLHVDHDHKTGRVRGILCADCNFGLGKFKDDPELLQAAIDYLATH